MTSRNESKLNDVLYVPDMSKEPCKSSRFWDVLYKRGMFT